MTLPPPLTLGYWFAPSPQPLMLLADRAFLVICVACLIAGIAALLFRLRGGKDKLTKRALGRSGGMFITMACFGAVVYLVLLERVPYLSMRLWFLVWLVTFVAWAWSVCRFAFVQIPKIRKDRAAKEEFEKWLPKKKD